MSKKDNISSFQIAHSKIWADGEKYFSLFEKHIPILEAGQKVLVYDISNLEFICKLMSLNKDAEFWIYGNQEVNEALRVLGFSFHEVAEDLESKTYNIPDMKFDCIIMNPPYQRNLHLKILAESIKHLKDDKSVCVNLSPVTWADKRNICHPKGEWRKKLNGKINSLDFIEHRNANDMFGTGNAIEDLAITTYKNNGTFDIINYGFTSKLEASLFKKINIFRKDRTIFTLNQAIGKSSYGSGNGKNVIRKKYDVPIHK